MKKCSTFSPTKYFELFWIRLKTSWVNMVEYLKVFLHYYFHSFSFMRLDFYLLGSYIFNSPFRISKKFLELRGEEEVHAYGETPLTTLEMIAHQCRISEKDTVFELGCGRGRTCFWLGHFIKCKVIGVEFVPEFVNRAENVKKKFGVDNVSFRNEDMLETDLTGATVIYLYGTCLEDEFISKLSQKLSKLPSGTKIITVSYPITDYASPGTFEVMKKFPAKFTWGTADVFMSIRV